MSAPRVFAVAGLALVIAPRTASPCSFPAAGEFAVDAAFGSDVTPPGAVTASATVARYPDPHSSCFDIAQVVLEVAATDDAAPADRIGFQLQLAGGNPPLGLQLPAMPVTLETTGTSLLLFFDYRDQDGFAFDLEIGAIDLNGNVGPKTVLAISETASEAASAAAFDDAGGCMATGSPSSLAPLFAFLSLALARSRRRT